jgi:hypothetical protein
MCKFKPNLEFFMPHVMVTLVKKPTVCSSLWKNPTGRSLHYQVKDQVRTKFATPIIYAIDNFKNYNIFFYIYMTIDNIFCIFFWNFWSSSFFLIIVLVQFCIILVRNNMFSRNKISSILVILFSACNKYHVYLLMKKIW